MRETPAHRSYGHIGHTETASYLKEILGCFDEILQIHLLDMLLHLTLLHSEWPKLYGVLASLSTIGLNFCFDRERLFIKHKQIMKTGLMTY